MACVECGVYFIRFYVDGTKVLTPPFNSLEEASSIAMRLAKGNPGKKFEIVDNENDVISEFLYNAEDDKNEQA